MNNFPGISVEGAESNPPTLASLFTCSAPFFALTRPRRQHHRDFRTLRHGRQGHRHRPRDLQPRRVDGDVRKTFRTETAAAAEPQFRDRICATSARCSICRNRFATSASIPYADLFADAVESYWRAAAIGKERGEENSRARGSNTRRTRMQRAIARQTLRYESSMIFLASIVSGAPFIGLLGTVWGVMEAFSAVAAQQTRRHSAARAGRFGRDARDDRRPGRGDSVGVRLQSAARQHAPDDHGTGKLRELAARTGSNWNPTKRSDHHGPHFSPHTAPRIRSRI